MSDPWNIDELLQQPGSIKVAQQLNDWADSVRNQIARGDMMLGILSVEDVAKIPTAYERAAEYGLSIARLKLAWWHAMPEFGDQNMANAESVLEAAVDDEVDGATLELIKLRWFFMRESASEDKRVHTFQLAQSLGDQSDDGEVLYFLALLTTHGFGTSASPDVGFELQQQAADLGNTDAMFELYIHHANGLGTKPDKKLAFAACERAAEAGHHRAMYNLGAFNATGRGTSRDMRKAVEWYERAADAGILPQSLPNVGACELQQRATALKWIVNMRSNCLIRLTTVDWTSVKCESKSACEPLRTCSIKSLVWIAFLIDGDATAARISVLIVLGSESPDDCKKGFVEKSVATCRQYVENKSENKLQPEKLTGENNSVTLEVAELRTARINRFHLFSPDKQVRNKLGRLTMKLLSRRNLIIVVLALCTCILGYWYAPIHFAGSDPEIESLIDQLASTNSPPDFPGDPPHFYLEDFLANPGDWNSDAQRTVSKAYYELKSMGKDVFPYLIKHFGDNRYSHERSYSTFISHSVGDACQFLIDEQIDPRGISYKSRETPTGTTMGYAVQFEAYVKSKYGSYAAWWRNNRNLSLVEMRVDFCKWRINKEKQLGFVDDDQRNRMLETFDRMLENAKSRPDQMPLPPPDWYTVDAIVMDITMFRQNEIAK